MIESIDYICQFVIRCSKLTIETLEKGVKYVQNKWTYFTPSSSVSIVNFELAIAGWVAFPIQTST